MNKREWIQQVWIPQKQAKHPKCGCPCGEEIVVKPRHYYDGIPRFHLAGCWSKTERGREACSLGAKNQSREAKVRGGAVAGKIAGKIAVETGQIYEIASLGGVAYARSDGRNLIKWASENPDLFQEAAVKGGKVQGRRNVTNGVLTKAREVLRLAHPTSIERMLGEEIDRRRVVSESEKRIGWVLIDRFLPDYNIAIFADGCYWHGCPVHFPQGGYAGRKSYQSETTYLENFGYKVFRFWECKIRKDVVGCVNEVFRERERFN